MKKFTFFTNDMLRGTLAILIMAVSTLAHAHAYPTHQAPSAGSTVPVSQKDVAIDFDEGVEPAFSSIAVTDAKGSSVTNGKAVVDQANNKHLSVALQALTAGTYAVAWVALATDGHRTQGHYSFSVK